jgi:hypothetical protein
MRRCSRAPTIRALPRLGPAWRTGRPGRRRRCRGPCAPVRGNQGDRPGPAAAGRQPHVDQARGGRRCDRDLGRVPGLLPGGRVARSGAPVRLVVPAGLHPPGGDHRERRHPDHGADPLGAAPGFAVGIYNPTDVAQTIVGVPGPGAGSVSPAALTAQVAVSIPNRDIDNGGFSRSIKFTLLGAIPPHQLRLVRDLDLRHLPRRKGRQQRDGSDLAAGTRRLVHQDRKDSAAAGLGRFRTQPRRLHLIPVDQQEERAAATSGLTVARQPAMAHAVASTRRRYAVRMHRESPPKMACRRAQSTDRPEGATGSHGDGAVRSRSACRSRRRACPVWTCATGRTRPPAPKIRVCDGRLRQTLESGVGAESASSHERSPGSS